MRVSPDEIQEFAVALPKDINSYDRIDARAVFYDQPVFQSEPNFSVGVVNQVTFNDVTVETWSSVRSGPIWITTGDANRIRFEADLPRVLAFLYDGDLYPEHQVGTFELRLGIGSEFEIQTYAITVSESNKQFKDCVIDIAFEIDPDVQEDDTPGFTAGDIVVPVLYVPRVNTWRQDGQHVNFWRANTRTAKLIKINRFSQNSEGIPNYYGVDIFCYKTQGITVTANPPVPYQLLEPSAIEQDQYQFKFNSSATLKIRVFNKSVNFTGAAIVNAQSGQPFSYDIV